jgi:thiosulfate/3-mercaptopyruvate sulfurtransferase
MTTQSPRERHLTTTDWLAANVAKPTLRVFDCTVHLNPLPDNSGYDAVSGRADYDAGHIPESAFLDLNADLCDDGSHLRFIVPSPEKFAEKAGRLGIGDDTDVVVYDRKNGQWAARVWWMLRGFGFDRVKVLDGGYSKWIHEGRPAASAPKIYPPARLTVRPRPGFFVGKDEVMDAINDPGINVINALSAEQHNGNGGVHYGRKGRIPGSSNVPARGLTDPTTQAYLPDAVLRERLGAGEALDGRRVVAYCGGGIAASNLALGLALVGVEDVGIYTASLQEWANDATCPME